MVAMQSDRSSKINPQVAPPQVKLVYYPRNLSMSLGYTQIMLGIISIIVMIPAMVLNDSYMVRRASGIWCGIVYIVAGAITMSAGLSKNIFTVMASMVMSIFAALFSTAMVFHIGGPNFSITGFGGSSSGIFNAYGQAEPALAILTGLAYIELIVATLTSTLGCMVTCSCCGGRSQRLQAMVNVEDHHGDSRIIHEQAQRRVMRSSQLLIQEQMELNRLSGSPRDSTLNLSRSPTPQPASTPQHLEPPPQSYNQPRASPTETRFRPVEPAENTEQQNNTKASPAPVIVEIPPDESRLQTGSEQEVAGTTEGENAA